MPGPREKYYWDEYADGYARIAREGKGQWNDLFGAADFDDFALRPFLDEALRTIGVRPGAPVWEYGCGTGPIACRLAALGFRVRATDLIPQAVDLARRNAADRGLPVDFAVEDICALADEPARERYAVVVDANCLQNIVLDEDRARVFTAVRARLEPGGHYLLSTAVFNPDPATADPDPDPDTDYDPASGIRLRNGLPHRRHRAPQALRAELESAGFTVLAHPGAGGNLICRR